MVDPNNALNFINMTTQIVATLLGLLVIARVFWYENTGKLLKDDFGHRFFQIRKYIYKIQSS